MVNLGSVWDRTTGFLKTDYANVLPIAAGGIFVPLAALGILLTSMSGQDTPGDWMMGLGALALALVTVGGNLAVTALAIDPAAGAGGAIRTTAARLPVALAVAALGFVALFGPLVLLAWAFLNTMRDDNGAAATAVVGYCLLVCPLALLIAARLLLFTPALVAERAGFGALLRSLRLTQGMTWKLVGLLLLYLIVTQVAAMLVRAVIVPLGITALATILVALVQTGFSVFATAFTARLFLAVRDMREMIVELS
ncbi:hypothetical protein [Sphingomonas immobilis]|uniref:Integral membrane protein n=1 Tax=Sphingomonas immobilis TaxID=3063997 RepID=A0ABT8ZZM3_9SPHN|nr:hypothetical protein [Sphingomonas sp. CA1-15]MDO7842569.1 hypothetical protein [Sphingomonas sp. CA1-15]